jgi:hypothetical protein
LLVEVVVRQLTQEVEEQEVLEHHFLHVVQEQFLFQ